MAFDVLGLAGETQHVYTVLVQSPRCTASELAAACGVPATVAGRRLATLVRDGLATRTAGRPPRFSAVAPDVALTALIQAREHQLDTARSLVNRLAEAHREAARISDPHLAVELFTDREDISVAVRRLIGEARHEVRAFDRPPYVARPGSNFDVQTAGQRTGVTHRVIYDREAVAWPGRLANDILPSIRAGERARMLPDLPIKLVISDDRWALMPFSLAPGGQSVAYLVHHSPMLVALESLFEALWEQAQPLVDAPVPAVPGGGDDTLDPDTRTLLALLAAGLTDAAIARAQGWSERTTQRRLQRLMARLGATTRFQASLTAARRGWL